MTYLRYRLLQEDCKILVMNPPPKGTEKRGWGKVLVILSAV